MHDELLVLGSVTAVLAAIRSTWSPCGQSMLSQLTPVAERARGHRYGVAAGWFLLGALAGGLTLALPVALVAALVRGASVSLDAALVLGAVAASLGAAVDSGVLGIRPPFLRRQVNEDWLVKYRPWFYASGFGWQIGTGLTTYLMTAAVPVTVVLAGLTASPAAAVVVVMVFATVRGLAVLLTAACRTQTSMLAFHRRFDALGEPVRRLVIAGQLVVAAVAAGIAWGVAGPIAVGAAALFAAFLSRRGTEVPARSEPRTRATA